MIGDYDSKKEYAGGLGRGKGDPLDNVQINPHMNKSYPGALIYEDSHYNPVSKPEHYMLFPDTEVIEVIQASLTVEEYKGYLKGNVLKYRLRAGKKTDTKQDIDKAVRYEGMLRKL